MAATAAVLNTCELLEQIISFLPAGDIGKAQRVSRTWQELIQTSKIIQRARVLRPCNEANFSGDLSLWAFTDPTYTNETSIVFHPAVAGDLFEPLHNSGVRKTAVAFDITLGDLQRHDHDRDQMLTNPPISRAFVFTQCGSGPCEIYSPKGLTLRDAFEVAGSVLHASLCVCKKILVCVRVSFVGAEPVIKVASGDG